MQPLIQVAGARGRGRKREKDLSSLGWTPTNRERGGDEGKTKQHCAVNIVSRGHILPVTRYYLAHYSTHTHTRLPCLKATRVYQGVRAAFYLCYCRIYLLLELRLRKFFFFFSIACSWEGNGFSLAIVVSFLDILCYFFFCVKYVIIFEKSLKQII